MSELRIESGWLVRDVNEHTCGGSGTEWPYAHEPGCGTIPELRLDDLPGWPNADEAERLRKDRGDLTAEVVRLRTALLGLVAGWEAVGRSDLNPLVRGAVLSAAGQVRDVLWPPEGADDE